MHLAKLLCSFMEFLSGASARLALAMEVAAPPHHGQRSEMKVNELFESFKERFKQSRGQRWHSKMSVYMKDVFCGRDRLLAQDPARCLELKLLPDAGQHQRLAQHRAQHLSATRNQATALRSSRQPCSMACEIGLSCAVAALSTQRTCKRCGRASQTPLARASTART